MGDNVNFIYKLQRFMYGRYGVDDLYRFMVKLYLLLFLINIFINNRVLSIVELFIFFVIFFRFLSKDISSRRKENDIFLKIKNILLKPFTNLKRNIKDKNHIYKKCYKCRTTLKLPLPNKRGIKHAKCPGCGRKVTLFAFKKQKVEVIYK